MKSQTNTNDSLMWTATIRSHGFGIDALIAVPIGLLLLFGGAAALVEHYSLFTSVVGVLVLMFAGVTLASCAYSLWGTCFVSVDAGSWSVTRSLWRWSSTMRFLSSSVRAVSLYRPVMASFFPGSSGWYVQVMLTKSDRPLLIAEGMHASEDELEPIRAMIEKEAHLS